MNEYIIIQTNTEDYDRLVLCLTCESLLTYIEKIEATLAKSHTEGKILIDQLLITGDGLNRFISCIFSKGRLNFKTTQTVEPSDCFKKETIKWLHNNYSYVENSILTEEQRQKIKDNVVF